MTQQEIQACIVFMNRTSLNAQEIPAWQAVAVRLQEMLKAAQENEATVTQLHGVSDGHSSRN